MTKKGVQQAIKAVTCMTLILKATLDLTDESAAPPLFLNKPRITLLPGCQIYNKVLQVVAMFKVLLMFDQINEQICLKPL